MADLATTDLVRSGDANLAPAAGDRADVLEQVREHNRDVEGDERTALDDRLPGVGIRPAVDADRALGVAEFAVADDRAPGRERSRTARTAKLKRPVGTDVVAAVVRLAARVPIPQVERPALDDHRAVVVELGVDRLLAGRPGLDDRRSSEILERVRPGSQDIDVRVGCDYEFGGVDERARDEPHGPIGPRARLATVVRQLPAAADRLLSTRVRHRQPTVHADVTVANLAELPVEDPVYDDERTVARNATARGRHGDVAERDVDVVGRESAVDRRLAGGGVRSVDVHCALAESESHRHRSVRARSGERSRGAAGAEPYGAAGANVVRAVVRLAVRVPVPQVEDAALDDNRAVVVEIGVDRLLAGRPGLDDRRAGQILERVGPLSRVR